MDRMEPLLKRCSNCNYWKGTAEVVDDVIVKSCEVNWVKNSSLGLTPRKTKGSDFCGKWEKVKPPKLHIYTDEEIGADVYPIFPIF